MNAQLAQISVKYVATEDRLLLRLGTSDKTEYRLWLTRRFITVLWPALHQRLNKTAQVGIVTVRGETPPEPEDLPPHVRDAVLSMQHQEALQDADFSTPHADDNVDVTDNSGPLLIIGGRVEPWKDGKVTMHLRSENNMDITFALDSRLLHALCHLISTGARTGEWELELSVGEPAKAVSVPDVVH